MLTDTALRRVSVARKKRHKKYDESTRTKNRRSEYADDISKIRQDLLRRSYLIDSYRKDIIDDRRRYYPLEVSRRVIRTDGREATYSGDVDRKGRIKGQIYSGAIYFDDTRKVEICRRRKKRRAILFSIQKTGKGSGRKDRRYNDDSEVRCK